MDIHKWLDEIIRPESPSKLAERATGEPLPASKTFEPVLSRKHRRQPSRSDSSLLDPLTYQEKKPVRRQRAQSKERINESTKSYTSQDTRSLVSSHQYVRRPRRKTRPERYEPSSKITRHQEGHSRPKRRDEAKLPQRKSKRKKHDSGLVQGFRAGNVSGDRLTLKPREQLGIFNKGKTSTAAKGRGLPDLVFSEMKFLRKQRDEQEPELDPQVQPTSKRRKTDHNHSKNEEVSAFFTSRYFVPEEKGTNPVPISIRQKENALPNVNQPEREQPSCVQVPLPTVEMSDEAKSLKIRSENLHHNSTSYVSWSKSSRASCLHPVHSQTNHRVQPSQLDVLNDGNGKASAAGGDVSCKQSTPPFPTRQKIVGIVERCRLSSVTPLERRISRSQSCPQRSSSPRRLKLGNEAVKLQNTEPNISPASLPACIPVRLSRIAKQVQITDEPGQFGSAAASLPGNKNLSNCRQPVLAEEEREVHVDLSNSPGLWSVVQQCNTAIHDRCQSNQPGGRSTRIDSKYSVEDLESKDNVRYNPTFHQISRLRSADNEKFAPWLPNFTGPGIYEEQAQRSQLPLESVSKEKAFFDPHLRELEYVNIVDGLDYAFQNWDESPATLVSDEPRMGIRTYGLENNYLGERTALPFAPPGFWRPNRLY